MPQHNFKNPNGAQVSSPIATNTTTLINSGSGSTFAGALVNAAGSGWTAEIYNGNPASGGVLLTTIPGDTVQPVPSPYLRCPNGLYVVTAGTTAGSLNVAFYA